ncbi:MAG: ABC-2 family transporter protein [Clostridium sp.]|nr:ABC-2 family transporter protein [Clostridium sp.]
MSYLKKQLEVMKEVAYVTYKEWSAYRTYSMVSIFVGPVFFIVQYFIWHAIYGNQTSLQGMELQEMIRYFGVSTLVGYLVMDFADWNLSMLVRTGKFLTFAIRPIHHRFFALSQKVGHRILGFVFEFLPCLVIFQFLFRINMKPDHLGWFVLSVMLAFLMHFYAYYIMGLLAFWLVKTDGIREVFALLSSICSGALIPLVFFPHWLQVVQFFLPFQYIIYVPSMVFTGKYALGGITMSIPEIVGVQAIAVLVVFFISEGLYKLSMKHFTGVGA